MKRTFLIACVLLCAVASASADPVVLAYTGQPAPSPTGVFVPYDIGNGLYSDFTYPALNSNGQIAFRAYLNTPYEDSDEGIFRVDSEGGRIIAQEGLRLPSWDGKFKFFFLPSINSSGQVAFWSEDDNVRTGIYTGTGDAWPTQVVRENESAPGGNGRFDHIYYQNLLGLDTMGNVAFRADFKETTGLLGDSGIVLTVGSVPKTVIRESAFVSLKGGADNVAMSNSGQVAFWARLPGSGGTPTGGIYHGEQGSNQLLVQEGQVLPDATGTFLTLDQQPSIYDSVGGHPVVAFRAYLENTTGIDDDSGLWKAFPITNPPHVWEIARRGDAPPDGNGLYDTFSKEVSLNGDSAAFLAHMRDTSDAALFADGIYRSDQFGPIDETIKIARGGDAATGAGGGVIYRLHQPVINHGGQVAFRATLWVDGSSDNEAIYIGNGGILLEVARTGDPLMGSTIDDLHFATGPDYRNGFNKHCQVAYRADLTNGRQVLVLTTPLVEWTGGSSGGWPDNANWTLGIEPAEVHDVVIAPGHSVDVAGPRTNATVKSLTIGDAAGNPAALSLVIGGDMTVVNTCSVMPGGAIVIGDGRSLAAGDIVNQGTLTFQSGVGNVFGEAANGPGGTIVVPAGAEAWMHGPLDNQGSVDVAAGAEIHLAGLTGNGSSGGGTVWLGGEVRAGTCIGVMNFGGDVVFDPGSLTYIGLNAAACLPTHDLIVVEGDLTLGGSLVLESCAATPAWLTPGEHFEIIDVMGTAAGRFLGLNEGAQAAIFDGMPLHITYVGGDGNDVELYAVPEPATLALLAIGGLSLLRRRRR